MEYIFYHAALTTVTYHHNLDKWTQWDIHKGMGKSRRAKDIKGDPSGPPNTI
jgi:hypothetical protein